MSPLLTIPELAALLSLHPRTIEKRRAAGTLGIPEINIAPTGEERPSPRFRPEDVADYLQRRTVA